MGELAGVLHAQGDLAGADALLGKVLDGRRRLLGKDHPETLKAVSGLAVASFTMGGGHLLRSITKANWRSFVGWRKKLWPPAAGCWERITPPLFKR
jgi:hypothetical protein